MYDKNLTYTINKINVSYSNIALRVLTIHPLPRSKRWVASYNIYVVNGYLRQFRILKTVPGYIRLIRIFREILDTRDCSGFIRLIRIFN